MKRSEKLFMLINKIDEKIISDAKGEPQKPNRITIEKRAFPIRETIAAAACFAVLAAGIFAVMRFRINNVEPEDSNPVTSSGSTLNSNDPEYSDEDLELQAILSELEPGYEVIDWFYNGVLGTEEHHFYFGADDAYGEIYYPLPDSYPQSYDEMEETVYKYFTDYTAGVFMKYVCHGTSMTQRPDGSYTITVEDKGRAENNKNPTFIEADGKMYGCHIGRGNTGKPYFNTAKVKSKTESAIYFTFSQFKPEVFFDNNSGLIKYQRGGWRLDYYMPWLDANNDVQLQEILRDLTASAEEIDRMFHDLSVIDGTPDIKTRYYEYYLIPEGTRTEPHGLFAVPQSYDEMEKLISRWFPKLAAEFYMNQVGRGKLTADNNIEFESKYGGETFLEIDGKMYRSNYVSGMTGTHLGIDIDTAKVTNMTENSVEFSYMGYDYTASEGGDKYSERNGAIAREDGVWKLNYFCYNGFIPEMPNEFTEEDLELQAILKELRPGEDVRALFYAQSAVANGEVYRFILPHKNVPEEAYFDYIDVSGEQPQEFLKQPKSLDELKQMLLEYFTEESTAQYMSRVCKGTMTENDDGSYTVALDKDISFPVYIEINGKMFYRICDAGGEGRVYNTEKVVFKTDDTIKYSYVYSGIEWSEIYYEMIKYERGGWKMAPYDSDTEKKSELNTEILSDLGLTYQQLVEKRGELVTNTYKGVEFRNGIGVYGWKSENGGDFYVDNDHTNPGGLPEAGGCNSIAGLRSSELLTNFTSPMAFDELCERYGFILDLAETEPEPNGYSTTFRCTLYDITFVAETGASTGGIDDNTVWWIFLNADCKDAKPVVVN